MIRPRKMKRVQMTVLKNDVNAVIEYLGRRAVMHFGETDSMTNNSPGTESAEFARIKSYLEKIRSGAGFLGVDLPAEPDADSAFPGEAEEIIIGNLCAAIETLAARETAARQEKQRIEEAFNEARAFANLNAPFADLDQLSYLTLRLGRLDPVVVPELKKRLAERAVLIPLGGEGSGRVLAASSRKGRFALDTELKNASFKPIAIPEGYQGVPAELIEGLNGRLNGITKDIENIHEEKNRMRDEHRILLRRLYSVLLMALAVEQLKSQFVSTSSIYLLSGWVPADMIKGIAADLSNITGGRTAIRAYVPDEIPEVRSGGEKVPVSLSHSAFVKGFEGIVFSYGVPLYGTIDPTPLVAFFFTLLFGIMFGDAGQGSVLLLAGLLTSRNGPLKRYNHFSVPLIAVGISSMIMGTLAGSVFTNENLLIGPTRFFTGIITGRPADRILHILPMAEKGGSVTKLFYFFGFTISIGVILNSLGLVINIFNCFILKKHEAALFSKTGLMGLLFFWYALFIAVRCITGGHFEWFDAAGLAVPALFIFFGPAIWRCIAREKPVLEHGLTTFVVEGLMEVWETASTYFSNTTSFLRVGAFALSHAVLAYVVFFFSEELIISIGGPIGFLSAALLMVFGNALIIVLEGLIVAIQVLRLQYYEFFGKFFSERGVKFIPFRFRK